MEAVTQPGAMSVNFLEAARQYRCANTCPACNKNRTMN